MKIRVSLVVPSHMPDGYKRAQLDLARRNAAMQLYDALWKNPLPSVVDVLETVERRGWQQEVVEIAATITPVQHRHIVVAHLDDDLPFPYVNFRPVAWLRRLYHYLKGLKP